MFSRTFLRRGISSYSVFLMRTKKHPTLVACKTGMARALKAAALFRRLSPSQKAALTAIGRKTPSFKRTVNKQGSRTRAPTKYNAFVKSYIVKNFAGSRTTSQNRLRDAAKAWRQTKKGKN